ncbi:beta-glucanase [Ruminococcus albus]|uniref:beta-glucanase n=1 Tax=Ruminococcus albus TaxID=1264 RepID=UPI000462E885
MRVKRIVSLLTAAAISASMMMTANAAQRFNGSYFGSGFDSYEWGTMEASDGWSNGGMFDCTWSKNNVQFSGGKMNLSITGNSWQGYKGAEYRTTQTFGFGMYDVSMKPIKNDGVVSSFFTYTGPSDGTVWDEIDIEFLGKNTNQVQFNYYTKGQGNHEYLYNLGFDASQSFHQYGFYWDKSSITWYVDKKPVYTAYRDIPQTPGKIMMNVWNGKGVDEWLNHYNGRAPLTAQYDWISYTAPNGNTQKQSSNNNQNNNNNNNNNQQQNNNNNNNNNNSGNFNSKQKYAIKSVNSGKALDVSWGSKDDGANVLQYRYSGYENQKWYLEKQWDGYYVIKCANSGKVLDVAWGSKNDGANVQQCSANGGDAQKWELRKVGSNYALINKGSGKALDVEGKSKNDNANVLQWRYTGGANQLWSIEAVY